MNKKQNKKVMLVALVILLAILLICVAVVGKTYSKYRTSVKGSANFPVAKWSFLANGENWTMANIELKNTYDESTLANGKIAPGTSGSFDVLIDATGSEVGVEYNINFYNIVDEPGNLIYTYEGITVETLKELEFFLKGRIGANDTEKQKLITINWQWQYETGASEGEISVGDQIDTDDSNNLNNFKFDIYVIGNQEKPV